MSTTINPENIEPVKDVETTKEQILETSGESTEGQLAVGHVPVPGTGTGTGKKKGSGTSTVVKK